MHRSKAAPYSITSSARAGSFLRHFDAERSCGLQIDDELELGGLQHWKVRWFGTLKDAASINTDLTGHIDKAGLP